MDEEPFTPTTGMVRDDYAYYGESSPAGTIERNPRPSSTGGWSAYAARPTGRATRMAGRNVQ